MGKSSVRSFQNSLIYYLPQAPGTFGCQMALTKNTVQLRSVKFIHQVFFLAMLVAKMVYFGHDSSNVDSFLVKTRKKGEPQYVDCSVYSIFTWHIHTIREC